MTELETHLLNALTRLEKQFNEQHKASEEAQNVLREMFEITSRENASLRQEAKALATQVNSLNIQLQQLEKHYSTKRG